MFQFCLILDGTLSKKKKNDGTPAINVGWREKERDLNVQHHDLLPVKKNLKKNWNLNVEHLDSL